MVMDGSECNLAQRETHEEPNTRIRKRDGKCEQ